MLGLTILSKPLRMMDLKLATIMCLNQTKRGDKIEFDQGIYLMNIEINFSEQVEF